MKDVLLFGLVLVAVFIALPVAVLLVRDWISNAWWRRGNTPEKLAAERRAYLERVLMPDWEYYERHLQRPVPAALREFYADRELITYDGIEYDETCYISTFEPLDKAALIDSRQFLGFDIVPFANSDGDPIYLRPGPTESDAVFIRYEGDETEQLAPDIVTFLQQLRKASLANEP